MNNVQREFSMKRGTCRELGGDQDGGNVSFVLVEALLDLKLKYKAHIVPAVCKQELQPSERNALIPHEFA